MRRGACPHGSHRAGGSDLPRWRVRAVWACRAGCASAARVRVVPTCPPGIYARCGRRGYARESGAARVRVVPTCPAGVSARCGLAARAAHLRLTTCGHAVRVVRTCLSLAQRPARLRGDVPAVARRRRASADRADKPPWLQVLPHCQPAPRSISCIESSLTCLHSQSLQSIPTLWTVYCSSLENSVGMSCPLLVN